MVLSPSQDNQHFTRYLLLRKYDVVLNWYLDDLQDLYMMLLDMDNGDESIKKKIEDIGDRMNAIELFIKNNLNKN